MANFTSEQFHTQLALQAIDLLGRKQHVFAHNAQTLKPRPFAPSRRLTNHPAPILQFQLVHETTIYAAQLHLQ